MDYNFNKAVFTYAVSDHEMKCFHQQYLMRTRKLIINYTDATNIYHSQCDELEVVIIGLCVDSQELIERENIAWEIVNLPKQTIEAVFEFSNRLSGKYIIIYSNQIGCYAVGDATCSIPLNYSGDLTTGKLCISPFDKMTADYFHYKPDDRLKKIRESADPAQTMPGDLTPYANVHALLPNQYLNLISGEVVRTTVIVPDLSFDEIIKRSIFLSENIARQFSKHYQLICPLTSGYDSRVVLSILQKIPLKTRCYTTNFMSEEDESDDIRIAKAICRKEEIEFTEFGYYDPPKKYVESINRAAGLINSDQTIKEAYSYMIDAGDLARINGNIIGQIGKSSVTNSVPNILATASFLTCKTHNRDKECKVEMRRYAKDIKKSGHQVCDLFVYENRCGRWGGQEEALYSLCGMNSLNIFNCRDIIFSWISVPRKQRVQKVIHLAMIQRTRPTMLSEPFNPDDKLVFLKKNWVFYYISTFVKQFLIMHNIRCD